jgi:hypothetical protein
MRIAASGYAEEAALCAEQVAVLLNGGWVAFVQAGAIADSEVLLRRALRIDEKVYGPEHPN